MLNYSFGDDSPASVILGHLLTPLPTPLTPTLLFLTVHLPLSSFPHSHLSPFLGSNSTTLADSHCVPQPFCYPPFIHRRHPVLRVTLGSGGGRQGGVIHQHARAAWRSKEDATVCCLLGLFLISVIFGSTSVLCFSPSLCLSASLPLSFFPCRL